MIRRFLAALLALGLTACAATGTELMPVAGKSLASTAPVTGDDVDEPPSATPVALTGQYAPVPGRWSKAKAEAWYAAQPWRVGANYLPRNAINQLEMWQADTFSPGMIDQELGWAAGIGMNVMRVYLHDLVWGQDPESLYRRMDEYLRIADKHGIATIFVFFDSCHWPDPKLGPQPVPIRSVHNSGWMNSPGRDVALAFGKGTLPDAEVARLKGYIQGTMARFKDDKRVVMWELFNEPGQGQGGRVLDQVAPLHQASWKWARAVPGVTQPLATSHNGSQGDLNKAIALANSDIISTHTYRDPQWTAELLDGYDRPVAVTEYLARTQGRNSLIQNILPMLHERRIWAVNWGLVAGKSGTIWAWGSRGKLKGRSYPEEIRGSDLEVKPGEPLPEPKVWFHDLLRADGTPYDPQEIAIIRRLTANPKAAGPGR